MVPRFDGHGYSYVNQIDLYSVTTNAQISVNKNAQEMATMMYNYRVQIIHILVSVVGFCIVFK